MKSGDGVHEFNRALAARGMSVASVSVRDGVDAMLAFYRNTRVDDCSVDSDGDMLLFQWVRLGKGAAFRAGSHSPVHPSGR